MLPVLNKVDWNKVAFSFAVAALFGIFLFHQVQSMRLTPSMMSRMASLPKNVVKYSQVPSASSSRKFFTRDTIPKGLLRQHNTKQGTWGVIHVLRGCLRYTINEGQHAGTYNLDVDTKGIIEPQVYHSVAPIDDKQVEFIVEFYRLPNTGPVDEQREGL